MTEIQQNRWDQLVRRVSNIVGGGSQVNDTLNELFPMVDVETLRHELLFLSGWQTGFGVISHAASVGDVNHVQLFNPVGSGNLVVCEAVQFRANAISEIRFAIVNVALANNNANEMRRDTREGITSKPIGQVRDVQQVAGLVQQGSYLVEANVTSELRNDYGLWTLVPGTGIEFATTVTNIPSQFNFFWRERVAEPAEVNF